MKTWVGFGTEHSMNLVMIGSFRDAADAEEAVQIIDTLTAAVNAEIEAHGIEPGEYQATYPESISRAVRGVNVHSLASFEMEQFAYDVTVVADGATVRIQTDEVDVSAFLKVLLDRGATVQVFSAHDYPEAEPADEALP